MFLTEIPPHAKWAGKRHTAADKRVEPRNISSVNIGLIWTNVSVISAESALPVFHAADYIRDSKIGEETNRFGRKVIVCRSEEDIELFVVICGFDRMEELTIEILAWFRHELFVIKYLAATFNGATNSSLPLDRAALDKDPWRLLL